MSNTRVSPLCNWALMYYPLLYDGLTTGVVAVNSRFSEQWYHADLVVIQPYAIHRIPTCSSLHHSYRLSSVMVLYISASATFSFGKYPNCPEEVPRASLHRITRPLAREGKKNIISLLDAVSSQSKFITRLSHVRCIAFCSLCFICDPLSRCMLV